MKTLYWGRGGRKRENVRIPSYEGGDLKLLKISSNFDIWTFTYYDQSDIRR